MSSRMAGKILHAGRTISGTASGDGAPTAPARRGIPMKEPTPRDRRPRGRHRLPVRAGSHARPQQKAEREQAEDEQKGAACQAGGCHSRRVSISTPPAGVALPSERALSGSAMLDLHVGPEVSRVRRSVRWHGRLTIPSRPGDRRAKPAGPARFLSVRLRWRVEPPAQQHRAIGQNKERECRDPGGGRDMQQCGVNIVH